MQDNGYRLIKLKNGDILISKVLEIRKKTLVVERPMQFKTVVLVNQNNMTNTEMVVFKPWIDYTIDRITEIAADGIIAISMPDSKISSCYDLEKEKEDNPAISQQAQNLQDMTEEIMGTPTTQNSNVPPENVNVTFSVPPDMAEEIIDMMAEAKAWENIDEEDFEDEDLFPEVKPRKKAKKKKKVDPSSNKPHQKKNKKDSNDFGNDWSDWSPDPKDYI
jgi:hypothetical protein